jgi:peptide/nickel transport system permease protein
VVLLGQSMPTFWLGMLLILLFAVHFRLLPVSGRGSFAQLVLPSVTLAMWLLALLARLTRSGMLDVLAQDYVRTAQAKGLAAGQVLIGHALKNAAVPIATIIGIGLGLLISGVVVTETVFAIPGLGRLTVDAILRRDYPIIQGVTLLFSAAYVVVNLLVDLSYMLLDPRVRY